MACTAGTAIAAKMGSVCNANLSWGGVAAIGIYLFGAFLLSSLSFD